MTQTKQSVTADYGDALRNKQDGSNSTAIVSPSAPAVNVLLEAALAYARRGWHIFPCHTPRPGGKCSCDRAGKPACEHVGKHPRTAHGFLDATTDPATIMAWWQKWPDANIGGAAGAKSGFDAADPDGEAGLDDLARLEVKHGALPDTPTSITGGGGKHLLFKHQSGKKNTTDADGLDIDLRTTGGYIILPPSLHKSGRSYAWEASAHPDDVPLADMPVWLRAIFPDRDAPPRPAAAATTTGTHGGTQTDIPDGRRNSTLTSKAGSMHRANYSPAAITAALWLENVEKCKPPLTRSEVERIVASVTRYPPAPRTNGTGLSAPDLPPITYSDLDAPPEDREAETIMHMAATPRPAAADQAITNNGKKLSDRYATALATLGFTFRLNEANDEVEVNGSPMSDAMRATIRTDLRDVGLSKHLAAVEDYWTAAALKNAYHPFRSWLDGVQWDGRDHIATLATKFMHDMHDPITWPDGTRRSVIHTWLFHWLVGAVGKLYAGDQNTMLVLDGAQDLGKSFFCHWLGNVAPGGYLESPIDTGDKDHDLRLLKHLVWEVSELGATTRKQDTESLKAFITKAVVTVRKPYGHHDICKPAICSLIGTVNNADGFLNDPTGTRRFMVATLDGIDWRYADQVDPAQVWATAYAAWKSGARGRLDEVAVTRRTALNAEYKIKDSMSHYFDLVVMPTGESYDYVEFGAVVAKLVMLGYRGTQRQIEMALSSYLKDTGATIKRSAAGFRVLGFVLK